MGPLLFLLYINDLPTYPALLFADNVKICRPIVNQLSFTQLQQDLLILKEWSRKWLLNFSNSGRALILGNTNSYKTYYMDGQPLQVVSEHKDLGILNDSNLKFHS